MKKENNTEVTIKKIPLKPLLDILQDVWEKGADYVDIIGVTGDVQNNVLIAIRDDYMNSEEEEEQSPKEEKHDGDGDDIQEDDDSLTDDELNLLL